MGPADAAPDDDEDSVVPPDARQCRSRSRNRRRRRHNEDLVVSVRLRPASKIDGVGRTRRRVPLVPIVLLRLASTKTAAAHRLVDDALLRACVRRLLVGKVVSRPWTGEGEEVDHDDDRGETIVLRVPRPTGRRVDDDDGGETLEFVVIEVDTAIGKTGKVATDLVVVPSTRIVFLPSSSDDDDGVVATPVPPPISSTSSSSSSGTVPPAPHELLVDCLRSILSLHSSTIEGEEEDGYDVDDRRRRSGGRRRRRPTFPRSFLLSGPPGVGKTRSVRTAVDVVNSWSERHGRCGDDRDEGDAVRLVSIRGSELSSTCGSRAGVARELRGAFVRAIAGVRPFDDDDDDDDDCGGGTGKRTSRRGRHRPGAVVVFLDECDALVSSSTVAAATLAAILDEMEGGTFDPAGEEDDDYENNAKRGEWERVLVVAATNRVDAIPDCLRRPGRLEREIVVRPPDADERYALLRDMLREIDDDDGNLEGGLRGVADACVGYVAADLSALVRRAAQLAMEGATGGVGGCGGSMRRPGMTVRDLTSAMADVGASCLRDAAISAPPETAWDDVAGDAGGAKRALREAIEWPRTRRSAFEALGLSPPRGVLLHGPPGCGKTSLARAAAGAAGVAFLSLGPADVYSTSYVGDAEAAIRRAFDLARSAAPCVLFFDEIDAIVDGGGGGGDRRGHGMGRGSSVEARVLSTFLNEMDGVDGSAEDGVLVLGATNRPGALDAALLRPGRFDRVVYVPQPDEAGRKAILLMECERWRDALFAYYSHPDNEASETATDAGQLSPDCVGKYFNVDILASDEVSGLMTGAEIVGSCRESAVSVMRTIIMESHSEGDGTLSSSSKTTAESHLKSLMRTLEITLGGKTPLLSSADVLDEYTTFERNNNHK